MTEAYVGKTYNMQYSITPGLHATDLIPLFLNPYIDIHALNKTLTVLILPIVGSFFQAYQSYFTSHARTGDPNSHAAFLNLPWPKVTNTSSEYYTNVMDVGDLWFSYTTDQQNPKSASDLWVRGHAVVTNTGGYAPEDAVIQQSLVALNGSASVSYSTPGT